MVIPGSKEEANYWFDPGLFTISIGDEPTRIVEVPTVAVEPEPMSAEEAQEAIFHSIFWHIL